MSTVLAHDDRDEVTLSREVLESLPQSLYRSLPWPSHTIDACLKIVSEAQRMQNPRRVRAWIDCERAMPSSDEILGCLDGVLHQMTRPGVGFSDRIRFANKIRQDAVDYLRATGATAKAASSLDPNAVVLADGMVAAMRLHDAELADHSNVTADFAQRLALAVDADPDTIARTTLTARLHDIGKMKISRAILQKPMPLTAAERAEVCAYPAMGAETLAALPALAAIAPLVAAHRERVDGTGYPLGHAGDEIPLESRIVSIADAFHTMTLPRAYRNARTMNEALEELMARSGTQFDANLVTAFVSMIGYRARIARSA
jgi:HD-GYP domain-containing protein (c-di-GMP phosphodiesterase class II)